MADESSSEQSILGSLWDTATNVFKQVSNIELERYEAKRLAEVRETEQAAKVARDETLAGTAVKYISYADDPTVQKYALFAGIGLITVAFILLLKD